MDLNIRGFSDELAKQLKVEAARDGVTLKEYLTAMVKEGIEGGGPRVIEKFESGGSDGDDEGRAKSGVRSDHGKTRAAERGGAGDIPASHDEAGGLPKAGQGPSGMPGLRGGVRHDSSDEGHRGVDRDAAVRGPHGGAQPESGRVDGGPKADTVRQGIAERKYLGPAHSKTCQCAACRTKRGEI